MLNIRQEVSVPDFLINFKGKKLNSNNSIQNETSKYSLGCGEKSKFDEVTLNIFKAFEKKMSSETSGETDPENPEIKSYFTMIEDYNVVVKDLDQKFDWHIA